MSRKILTYFVTHDMLENNISKKVMKNTAGQNQLLPELSECVAVSKFSCVEVVDLDTGIPHRFCFEGAPHRDSEDAAIITQESPIGKSLLSRKVGDTIEVQVPAGSRRFRITRVDG